MLIQLTPRITLTDEGGTLHALIDGQHYGPQDRVPGNGHAWSLVFREAVTARLLGHVSTAELEAAAAFWRNHGF